MGKGSKGGKGKCGDDDDDDDSGSSKGSKGSKGDDDDDDDFSGDDDDDDDDDSNSACHSIKKIPKKISKTNTPQRSRSEHWRFYCDIFEHYYITSHCVNDRCGPLPGPTSDVPFGLQFELPIYEEMEKGTCLLLQFHDDICPADTSTACQCDSAQEWNPITEKCDTYQGEAPGEDLALIGYCEALTGGSWDDPLPGIAEVSKECLRGCTRYIAAEGHACCPHTCDCTAQYRECPRKSCAYCRSCCETCDAAGCDDVPAQCREPCDRVIPIDCPCIGQPDCLCDIQVLPIECPCLGQPDCFCEPCVTVIELEPIDEAISATEPTSMPVEPTTPPTEPTSKPVEEPEVGSIADESGDTGIANGGSPEEPQPTIDSGGATGTTQDGEENVSNDEDGVGGSN